MNTILILVRVLAGFALGVFFYGGLWLTVRRLSDTRHPGLLTLGSFWIRTLLVVGGFLFVMAGRWDYALWSLIGFTAGRFAVVKLLPGVEAKPKCT
jgi:F1F0 ATPase subunit 2